MNQGFFTDTEMDLESYIWQHEAASERVLGNRMTYEICFADLGKKIDKLVYMLEKCTILIDSYGY
jgi:hypothetical protein